MCVLSNTSCLQACKQDAVTIELPTAWVLSIDIGYWCSPLSDKLSAENCSFIIVMHCLEYFQSFTPPFPSSAFCLLVAPCQAIGSKHLSSIVNHLLSKYQAYANYLSSKYQAIVNHVPSKHQATAKHAPSKYQSTVHSWYMLGISLTVAWYMLGACLVHAWYMLGTCLAHGWQVLAANRLTRSNKQTESAWRKWWCTGHLTAIFLTSISMFYQRQYTFIISIPYIFDLNTPPEALHLMKDWFDNAMWKQWTVTGKFPGTSATK